MSPCWSRYKLNTRALVAQNIQREMRAEVDAGEIRRAAELFVTPAVLADIAEPPGMMTLFVDKSVAEEDGVSSVVLEGSTPKTMPSGCRL